ncbi:MAG: MotA/TolQ/ExbB proton channel family protein [Patescibacteria group bacterium]
MDQRLASPYCFLATWLFFLAIGIVFSAYMWWEGLIYYTVSLDNTKITWLIIAVFFIGLALITHKMIYVFGELNKTCKIQEALSQGDGHDQIEKNNCLISYHIKAIRNLWQKRKELSPTELHDKNMENIVMMLDDLTDTAHFIADSLVTLGLLGTVAGIIIALSGFMGLDIGRAEIFTKMVRPMSEGMATAFITTLYGQALWLFLKLLCLIVDRGTVQLRIRLSLVMWKHSLPEWNGGNARETPKEGGGG